MPQTEAMTPAFAELAAARFVLLSTFRRSGEAVPTTVWIAADGDDLLVTTPSGSGKVKRLRNNPAVTMVPSGRTGKVAENAVQVAGSAAIAAETERETRIFREKYRLEYRTFMLIERMMSKRTPRTILRITPA